MHAECHRPCPENKRLSEADLKGLEYLPVKGRGDIVWVTNFRNVLVAD
jgi:hypothetical protein